MPLQRDCGRGQKATTLPQGFRLSDQTDLKIISAPCCALPLHPPHRNVGFFFLIYTDHFYAHYEYWLYFLKRCFVVFLFFFLNLHVCVLLVDSFSPVIFVFKFGDIYEWKYSMCIGDGTNHSTALLSEDSTRGLVCAGEGTFLFPGLMVVEEIGLSHVYLPLLFSGRALL